MGSVRKQQGKENMRFLCDTVVNRFGDYIKIFYLGKQANRRKMESGRYPRWALVSVPTSVTFLVVSYFPNFLNIPKLTKIIFADFSESIYLPYHVPPLFHDSGVFRKVLLCVPPVS